MYIFALPEVWFRLRFHARAILILRLFHQEEKWLTLARLLLCQFCTVLSMRGRIKLAILVRGKSPTSVCKAIFRKGIKKSPWFHQTFISVNHSLSPLAQLDGFNLSMDHAATYESYKEFKWSNIGSCRRTSTCEKQKTKYNGSNQNVNCSWIQRHSHLHRRWKNLMIGNESTAGPDDS